MDEMRQGVRTQMNADSGSGLLTTDLESGLNGL